MRPEGATYGPGAMPGPVVLRSCAHLGPPGVSVRRSGPDGLRVVFVRVPLAAPLEPGSQADVGGSDPVRLYGVVSCSRSGSGGAPGSLPCWDLVLQESSPAERLAWEVMSS